MGPIPRSLLRLGILWRDDLRVVRFGERGCIAFFADRDGAGPSNAPELAPGIFTSGPRLQFLQDPIQECLTRQIEADNAARIAAQRAEQEKAAKQGAELRARREAEAARQQQQDRARAAAIAGRRYLAGVIVQRLDRGALVRGRQHRPPSLLTFSRSAAVGSTLRQWRLRRETYSESSA